MTPLWRNLALVCLVSLCSADYESDSQTITVLHSLDPSAGGVFVPRGTVSVRSLRSGGSATYQPAGALSDTEINQLKSLVESDGLYRIKLVSTGPGGRKTEVATFIKACQLAVSGLQDTLQLTVDSGGTLVAASLLTSAVTTSHCPPDAAVNLTHTQHFTTDVLIHQIEPGPIPDTASFIQKLEQEKQAKERGETKDNRSFLAKYWMYIVPAVLLLMVSSGPEAPAGGGGGGGR